jgi:putative N6-adenine-specific DNA methylase
LENKNLKFHATVSQGFLPYLEKELSKNGIQTRISHRGGIYWDNQKDETLRFLRSTRFTSQVNFIWKTFTARDYDDLYSQSIKFPWETIIEESNTYRIDSNTSGNLSHSQFALYRLKDSINDRFQRIGIRQPIIDKDRPSIRIYLYSSPGETRIEFGISSNPLQKRGYRDLESRAPIRETMAQLMIEHSGWNGEGTLIDPFCGGGTILIEAALIMKNPDGLNDDNLMNSPLFFKIWPDFKKRIPSQLSTKPIILGIDQDQEALQISERNSKKAGVSDLIQFKEGNFFELDLSEYPKPLYFITNPPYGERLSTEEESRILFTKIGNHLKDNYKGSHFTLITGNKSLLGNLRMKDIGSISVKNAKLDAKISRYEIFNPENK